MVAFFGKGRASRLDEGVWPKSRVIAALKKRYDAVDDLGEEGGFSIYGVTDGEIRFAVVMALVEGAKDRISEVGFLARFSGFNLSQSQLEGINRNLHISIAAFHTDGDLYLIGGVTASGAFSESTFLLVLEAWKRDLLVLIQSMSLSHTLTEAHPAARLRTALSFATNRVPDSSEPGTMLFAAYAGGAVRTLSVCGRCAGRGKTGFIARECEDCVGSGFVKAGRR